MSRIASGLVRLSRSLLPRTSRFHASNRAPRNSSSSSLSAWIIVPMAPSSTRMRSRASARSFSSIGEILTRVVMLRSLHSASPQTTPSSPAKAGDPVTTNTGLWLLDAPLARGMTACVGMHQTSRGLLRDRTQSQQMAHRVNKIGPVHRVEMEISHAAVDQVEHLLGSDGDSDQLTRRRVLIEAGEALGEPGGHRGAAALGEDARMLEVLHGKNAGH